MGIMVCTADNSSGASASGGNIADDTPRSTDMEVDNMQDLSRKVEAIASHIKLLTKFMVSGQISVIATSSASVTAHAIAQRFKACEAPQIMPDSVVDQPEAVFLQFFGPPEGKRDTIVLVAESRPLLYCLLRALYFEQGEALSRAGGGNKGLGEGKTAPTGTIPTAAPMGSTYSIGAGSITLVNVRSDGSKKVLSVGDCGHLAQK